MQKNNEQAVTGTIQRASLGLETKATGYRRWFGAVFCTTALHGAILGWLIWTPSYAENIPLPPPALMVTLAELPQAVSTEQTDISEETTQSEAREEQAKTEPPPPEEEPIMPEVKDEPQPAEVVVPPPVKKKPPPPKKPTPPPKKVEKPAKAPNASESQEASKATMKAQAQVTPSQQNAAPQMNAGVQVSPQAVITWKSQVMAQLERYKRYPSIAQSRGQRGVAFVTFTLDAEGNVISAKLGKSSGFSALDDEVVALAYRASPLPAPPDKKPIEITAPVSFMKE